MQLMITVLYSTCVYNMSHSQLHLDQEIQSIPHKDIPIDHVGGPKIQDGHQPGMHNLRNLKIVYLCEPLTSRCFYRYISTLYGPINQYTCI